VSEQTTNRYFDELARALASGSLSRRKALRLMGAALVGGALASIPGNAWAKPNKPAGAKCNHDKQCASGQCVDTRVGRVCGGGGPVCPDCPQQCACATDLLSSEPVCVNIISAVRPGDNCSVCVGGEVCTGVGPEGVSCSTPCP
jgi:hypothetical protein